MFAGSHDAAQRSAMIYSLVGTCKFKGIEPLQFFKNLLQILPDHKAIRKEFSLPVLNELEKWLKENIIQTTPATPIGKAVAYALSRW